MPGVVAPLHVLFLYCHGSPRDLMSFSSNCSTWHYFYKILIFGVLPGKQKPLWHPQEIWYMCKWMHRCGVNKSNEGWGGKRVLHQHQEVTTRSFRAWEQRMKVTRDFGVAAQSDSCWICSASLDSRERAVQWELNHFLRKHWSREKGKYPGFNLPTSLWLARPNYRGGGQGNQDPQDTENIQKRSGNWSANRIKWLALQGTVALLRFGLYSQCWLKAGKNILIFSLIQPHVSWDLDVFHHLETVSFGLTWLFLWYSAIYRLDTTFIKIPMTFSVNRKQLEFHGN